MPNARKKGLKLAAAFVTDATDSALVRLSKQRGYTDKASFLRALIDQALESETLNEDPVEYTATRHATPKPPGKRRRNPHGSQ